MILSREIVLAGACRTAIGKMGGSLASIPVAELGAIVIKEALKRAGVKENQVDEIFMGCVLQGAQGQNVARQASIKAGLSVEVPAQTLNIVCGSGLKSVNLAAAMIEAGEADVIVAGGMENMSSAVYALENARYGYRMNDGALIDTMIRDALSDAFHHYHMGVTAENVAEKFGVTRAMQNDFAVGSQQKYEAAQKAGEFRDEIVPVPIKVKKETILFDQDEFPRSGVTVESIAKLPSAFRPNATVTAANASGINDGAAAIVVLSAEKAKEWGVQPLATWIGGATAGVDPAIMGIAPVFSTQKLLKKLGLTVNDLDLIEANEAFAAQSIAVGKQLAWDQSKVNVNGGAIALGHPVGASGCRILVTLLYAMRKRGVKRGLATLCIGGGMGVSTVVENYGYQTVQ
jgi:acetyl-CoA C-acetyltransferase